MMNRLSQFCALAATLAALSGCNTVNDLVTSHLPERHSGQPSIVVSLREQEAYLYRGGYRTAESGYHAVEKDTAHRLVDSRSPAKTKTIAPASMATTLMRRARS